MKHVINLFLFSLLVLMLNSCKKDEGKKPIIEFRTGANYTSSDATVPGGTVVTIGIHAAKAEDQDVLMKFNASIFLEGVLATSDDTELTGADQDEYNVDYTFPVPTTPGFHYKLTFTVTNRDGLTNQVSLTLTAN